MVLKFMNYGNASPRTSGCQIGINFVDRWTSRGGLSVEKNDAVFQSDRIVDGWCADLINIVSAAPTGHSLSVA
jgi:hypothetical protein